MTTSGVILLIFLITLISGYVIWVWLRTDKAKRTSDELNRLLEPDHKFKTFKPDKPCKDFNSWARYIRKLSGKK